MRPLTGPRAWITGLRREQSSHRAEVRLTEGSENTKARLSGPPSAAPPVKSNPLANWTRSQVWTYLLENDVPYNYLHDLGYASIGCTHCTRPADNTADERAGRWPGHGKVECGIHFSL